MDISNKYLCCVYKYETTSPVDLINECCIPFDLTFNFRLQHFIKLNCDEIFLFSPTEDGKGNVRLIDLFEKITENENWMLDPVHLLVSYRVLFFFTSTESLSDVFIMFIFLVKAITSSQLPRLNANPFTTDFYIMVFVLASNVECRGLPAAAYVNSLY